MKMMRLLPAMVLALILPLITGCASTATKPLGAGEARISGQTATFWKAESVSISLDSQDSKPKRSLVVPAGKVRIRLIYEATPTATVGVITLVGNLSTNARTVEFTAKAGHEYYVQVHRNSMLTAVWNLEYKLIDQTTGQTVLVTTKDDKPSGNQKR